MIGDLVLAGSGRPPGLTRGFSFSHRPCSRPQEFSKTAQAVALSFFEHSSAILHSHEHTWLLSF